MIPKHVIRLATIMALWGMFTGTSCKPATAAESPPPTTAEEALEALLAGNVRFMENHPIHPDQTLDRIRDLQKGQHPFAVIVSCADSRVPPELIFDQGLGDLFVIRNAGNIIGDYELGSIEYAIEHLHTPLIVVMGHERCGALQAFVEHRHDSLPNHIQHIVNYIKAESEIDSLSTASGHFYEDAITANILHGIHTLTQSKPILAEYYQAGKLQIIGALYDLDSGRITLVSD